MKTCLKIQIHSFVDLITNSSSELFVCSTDKTVETVKQMIDSLFAAEHQDIWNNIMAEPEVCNVSFIWKEFPEHIRKEYLKHHEDPFARNWSFSSDSKKNHEVESLKRELLEPRDLYEIDKEEYNAKWAAMRQLEAIQEKNERASAISKKNLLAAMLIMNGRVDLVKKIKLADRGYSDFHMNDPELAVFIQWMGDATTWGMNLKKGDILIRSESDNSIPYEWFDTIESKFKAQRFHLG